MVRERGIFSIENVWFEEKDDGSIEPDVTSFEPILNALRRCYGMPFVSRDVATTGELQFFIKRWCRYPMSYPILHIGIHGTPGEVHLGDGSVSLPEIARWIRDEVSCKNCIVHFSSCSALRGTDMAPFLDGEGGFSAVSGYGKKMYPMVNAWPFEMIYFALLHKTRHKYLQPDAMRRIDAQLSNPPYAELKKDLSFRLRIAR